jgi:hypothetical protein
MAKKRGKNIIPEVTIKSERKEAWFRIIVAIVSGIILGLWWGLMKFIIFIHWLIVVFSGKRNRELAEFSEYFNTEAYKFLRYMNFVSNKRPFPFTEIERISKFS